MPSTRNGRPTWSRNNVQHVRQCIQTHNESSGEQWGELVQHSQFKQGKMPSTSSCPVMVGRQWYRHTMRRTISAAQSVETGGDAKHKLMSRNGRLTVIQTYSDLVQHGEQLVQHSQFKQGKMPSTSSCPEMVGRQWYRHTVRRTISAAQSVETGPSTSTCPEWSSKCTS